MSSITSNFFSSSECERLKSLLKNPEKDLEDILSLLESKVEERSSQLKEPNEYYQSLIDSLTHIGIGIDIVNKDYEILFQNQVLKERFGDCIGNNCFRSYMGLEKPCEFCPMEEALRDNKVEHVELKAADGRSYELISAPYPNLDGTIDKVAEVVIDITERKGIEQKLRESEEKYRILTEQSLMGIFIFQEGRFKYINQAVSDMNGYTIEEMLNWTGSDIAKTIYREDLENIMNRLKRSEQGDLDDSSSSNFRIITKTGQLIWVEEYNKRIEFQGAPASLVTLIDITNRVESEYNLRESEERYRGLINNITDIIYELSINGKCTYVSNQLFEISGFYPDEMIGQNVFNYLHPDDLLNIAEKVKEAFNTGTRISADFRLKHKKGYYVPVSSNFNMIDTNGDVRLIGVIRDNTEQKKAEDAFLKEKKFTEIAINAQRDTFFIFEPFTGKAVRWNQAFRENSGFSDEEISIMEAPYSYYNENDLKRSALAIEKISTEGEALIEMSLITKDGNEIPFEYLGSSINDDEGNLKYIVVIGRDITERKQVDEALQESERSLKMAQTIAHVGYWKLNPLTMVVSGSDELFDIFGLNHDEATLDAFTEVVHPDDREYDLYHINRGMEYGENWDIEHRLITKDGIEKWIHAIGEVIKDDKGNVLMLLGTIQDITDLKNAEQNIKESEEKFRLLFESIADPIHVIDADLKIIYMNPAFEKWLKSLNLDLNIVGKTPVEAWPFIGEKVNDEYQKVFKTKQIHIKEEWAHLKDIDTFTETRKIPIIKSGNVFQVITIVRDFSDRKKAEQKLKESEEKFRNFTEQSLMGVAIIQDSVVKYASKRLADIYGYSVEEMLNFEPNGFLKLIDPEFLEIVKEQATKKQLGQEGTITHYEVKCVKKTGEKFWVENYSKTIYYKGKPADFVTNIEITERKKTEQLLIESEEKYRLLFDNTPVGIGLSTIDGRVLDSNDTITKLTGYSAEDLNKIGASSIYADPSQRSEMLKLLKESGKLRDYEVKLRRKDNTEFFGSISFDLIELRGKKIIQTSLRDITKSKEAELELIKLSNLKSELLRRTSHELKTPLVSIKGFSDLLLDLHRDKLDDYVVSTLNEIRKGIVRLGNLISDILKTAELESGTIQVSKSKEDLSFLIRLCVDELKGFSELRKQIIKVEIPEPLFTLIEKEEIHKVISNILSNAIKYTPPYGIIEIISEIQDNLIIISVKDNGIGFTEEEKSRIFKQFGKIERYGQGMDVISEGSGLGLYISKKIIELHGGKIWVESEGFKKGSTFYFSLPLIAKF